MLLREIAPDFGLAPARAAPVRPARFRLERRDPRRFGQAQFWVVEDSPSGEGQPSDDLRLFAHSFAGFFLFFSVLIA